MAAEWPASVTTTGREFSVGDRVRVVSPAARGWPAAAVTAGFSVWVRLLASGASGGLYEWLPSAATLVGREGVVQLARLVVVDRDHETATALERNAHDDEAPLLDGLHRSVTRSGLHGSHAASPFAEILLPLSLTGAQRLNRREALR